MRTNGGSLTRNIWAAVLLAAVSCPVGVSEQETMLTADVFVGIIVLMFMVIIMDKVAGMVEKRVLRWQTQSKHVGVQG